MFLAKTGDPESEVVLIFESSTEQQPLWPCRQIYHSMGIGTNRRWLFLLVGTVTATMFIAWMTWRGHSELTQSVLKITHSESSPTPRETLFDQVFSVGDPAPYDYPTLAKFCRVKPATKESPYLNCTSAFLPLGLTSLMSSVKVCLKMTIDSGSHLILPKIPRRDTADMTRFNLFNPNSFIPYDQWFDAEHLKRVMARACPHTNIIHPDEIGTTVTVRESLGISLDEDPSYQRAHAIFWAGKTFREWFADHYAGARARMTEAPKEQGITVVTIDAEFMAFNIMNDASRNDLYLWNDLARVLRFPPTQREIVHRLLKSMNGPFYAVHFRAEKDNAWSTPAEQLRRTLEGLDKAWSRYGQHNTSKPKVYVACGDEEQANFFVAGAFEHGWTAVHKWTLLANDPTTEAMVNALPFDFMGAVDLGLMVKSDFFFGLGGSAMSYTAANYRDPAGHFRGSSFNLENDEGARNHLFEDLDSIGYSCCL